MVKATLSQKCHYLGRLPKNIKFPVETVLEDGSYLSWIAPDAKSKKKGGTKIIVRVIEYTIDTDDQPQKYPSDYQFDRYRPVSLFIVGNGISSSKVSRKYHRRIKSPS